MEIKRLGELCNIVSGGTPSRTKTEFWNNGTIPWVKIGDIKEKYINETDEFITKEGLDGSSTKMLPAGTILYTIFATLGEVGILEFVYHFVYGSVSLPSYTNTFISVFVSTAA